MVQAMTGQFIWIKISGTKIIKNMPAAQAVGHTLPDATPPLGKIHPFIKIAATFEQIEQFRFPSRFIISGKVSI